MLQLFWSDESQDDLLTLIEYVAARRQIPVSDTNNSGLADPSIAHSAIQLPKSHVEIIQRILREQVPQAQVFAFGSRVSGIPGNTPTSTWPLLCPNPLACAGCAS